MNLYIYRVKLNRPELLVDGPTEEETLILQNHAAHLERLASESTVLLAGRTQTNSPDDYGIVILRAKSEMHAIEIMNTDPAVKHQVMQAKLQPYRIATISDSIVRDSSESS